MAEILNGRPVAALLTERAREAAEAYRMAGATPTLALIRVGEDGGALAYEKSITARAGRAGVEVRRYALAEATDGKALFALHDELNLDPGVHGVMVFRPLPRGLDSPALRNAIAPDKDVDGVTDASLSGVFTGSGTGFAPCTAQACVEILKYYQTPLSGARVAVVGRSLVVGRPAAMLLMAENATVTLCHTKTRELAARIREADIVIAAAGRPRLLGRECFRAGQTVLDVGMHVLEDGSMCGDVDAEALSGLDIRITPVPGGVGAVTTAVLMQHVLSIQ